jgi:hypothetical protein
MDLTKDIIPQKYFQRIMIAIICLLPIGILWSGLEELKEFKSTFEANELDVGEVLNYTVEPLSLTKVNFENTIYTYVSVTDLSYRPPNAETAEILASASEYSKILGLLSHPSFLVKDSDLPFWRSQFYLKIGLDFLGWFLFIGVLIGLSITNFMQKQKLFTAEVYRWVFGLYFLIFAGFLAHPILYGRMIHFLNKEFNLGEPLTSGIASESLLALGILFFLIIFLQKAILIQKDQDLTV